MLSRKTKTQALSALLCLLLLLTACTAAMTGPQTPEEGLPGAGQAAVDETPSATPGASPAPETPAPDAAGAIGANVPEAARAFMEEYEAAACYVAPAFEDAAEEELANYLSTDILADFEVYGRKNSAGDVYALAVLPPTAAAPAPYAGYDLELSEVYGDERRLTLTEYGVLEGENGTSREALRSYDLSALPMADLIDREHRMFFFLLSDSDALLARLASTSYRQNFVMAQQIGLLTEPPSYGPYLGVGMMGDPTGLRPEELPGDDVAVAAAAGERYYFPLPEAQRAEVRALLEAARATAQPRTVENAAVPYCAYLYLSPEEPYELRVDGTICDRAGDAVLTSPALLRFLQGIIEERTRMDLLFDPTAWLAGEEVRLLSATLSFPDYERGFMRLDTLTNPEKLAALAALLTERSSPTLPPACPFGGALTLEVEENGKSQRLTLLLSSDSCAVFTVHGLSFYEYSDQEDLFALFPNARPG